MRKAAVVTANLELVSRTKEESLAAIDAMNPSDRAQVSPEYLERLKASTSNDPWMHGFAMVHRASREVVGQCGYKGPPDADGVVEIAYGVDPAHQSRGYATEAARGMTEFAFTSSKVKVVRAHTLPEVNASGRVLTKCGFTRVGEVIDPEDGLVWRWDVSG